MNSATDARRPWFARTAVVVAVVCAVSLAVRFAVLAELRAGDPLFSFAILDDAMYLKMARAMRDGTSGPWLMAPLHPWVLAQWGRLFGVGLAAACTSNAVLGAATSATCAYAARHLHSIRAAWCAGLLHAFAGGFVFYDIVPGQAPVLALLHVVGFVLAIRLFRRGGVGVAGTIGLLAGVAMLGRGTSLAIAFAAAPAIVRARGLVRARLAAAVVVGVAVVLAAASARNLAVVGDFTPFHWNGGPNLYASNGPDSRAVTEYMIDELGCRPEQIAAGARRVAESAEGHELSPAEVSAFWVARTWKTRGSVGEHLLHFARKAGLFLSSEEPANIHSPHLEANYSWYLSHNVVGMWWLLPLGLAGWWWARGRRPEGDAAIWVFAATWAALTLYFPVARYRVPTAAVCTVVAGAGIAELCVAWSARRRAARGTRPASRLHAPGPRNTATASRPPASDGRGDGAMSRCRALQGCALLAVVSALAGVPYRAGATEAIPHANLALAELQLGHDRDVALAHLDAALALEPGRGLVNLACGKFFIDTDPRRAARHLDIAARDPSVRDESRRLLLRALVAAGESDAAESLVHELYADYPNHPEVLAYAAVVAWNGGDRREATRRLAVARHVAAEADYAPIVWARSRMDISDAALDAAIQEVLAPVRRPKSGE